MINVGFIGCGAMGRDHVRRITDKCGNAQVVGVYDTVLGNAKQAIEDNRLDATIYDSADALIDDPNVDAVVIASRNDVHLDPLLHTIAIGKPTFTEKPMTINGSDSWKVVEAEVANGRKTIQVGFNWRFDPGYDAMKTFVGDGQRHPRATTAPTTSSTTRSSTTSTCCITCSTATSPALR